VIPDGKLRELARAYSVAAMEATTLEELPTDAWLNVRLRDLGCPEEQLAAHRARIRSMPLRKLADGPC
jgi:hypothetical protein